MLKPAFVLLFSSLALVAADETLPKAETILDRYVDLTGGKAAYEKRHNEVSHGTLELVGKGIKGTVTLTLAEPNRDLAVIDIEGVGKIESGTNGEVAWEKSVLQGARIKQGEEKADALRDATFNGPVRWREIYPKAETVGVETVNGHPAFKVVLTPAAGKPVTQYYDKTTGLLLKSATSRVTPMGEIAAEILFDDYRKDGDLIAPHRITNKAAGQEFRIQIQSTESNVELPKDLFKLPAEIQALLDKPSEPPPSPAAATSPEPAPATGGGGKLTIYMNGKPLASETYAISKSPGKVDINGSGGATLGSMKVVIEKFQVVTDDSYRPLLADAKAKLGTIQMNVSTTFADGKAKNQIDTGQGLKSKEDAVHADPVVVNSNLPLFPWSVLGMRAALKNQDPQPFLVYVLGQGEVPATVIYKGREKVEFASGPVELDHISASGKTPQGQPIALDLWIDANRRLIKLAVPAQSVEAYQEGFDRKAPAATP